MTSLYKIFAILGLIAVSLKSVRSLNKEEIEVIQKSWTSIVQECGVEFSIDEEQIKDAKKSGKLDSLDPCLFTCIGKKFGMINDKGEFDNEKISNMVNKFVANEEEQKKSLEIIVRCISDNDQGVGAANGCEKSVLLYKCVAPHKEQFPLDD